MTNAGKVLFSLFMVVIMVMYIMFRSDVVEFDTRKDRYEEAIQAAAQIATHEIIETSDVNITYDGDKRESQDIPINLDTLYTFRQTVSRILESKKEGSLAGVSNINIPLTGFVTYKYIVGVTYGEDGIDSKAGNTFLLPMGYILEVNSDKDSRVQGVWQFTLGNKITIKSNSGEEIVYTGEGTELIKDGESGTIIDIRGLLDSYGFSSVEQLRDYVVMDCIDRYLDSYSGASFNPVSYNVGSGLDFEMGKSNYTTDGNSYNTEKSSVIQGPGLFAIIDIYTGSGNDKQLYQRIASFGGSELVER